jgi:uncharacterized protein
MNARLLEFERSEILRREARHHIAASAPQASAFHILRTDSGNHLFVVDGSRLFDSPGEVIDELEGTGDAALASAVLDCIGLKSLNLVDDEPLVAPPVHALSLAVAQKCNLGCTYCYAHQGDFGGTAKKMDQATADAAVEFLLSPFQSGARVNLAFLGGEPLANRAVLQETARRATSLARARGITITFSITTNGTLLREDDARFFEDFGFAVTVSLDGVREVHDLLRPYKDGRGSYDRIMQNVRPLLEKQRKMQVSARVTVTPRNLGLREALDEFLDAGFHSVGFSPMLSAPNGVDEMHAVHLEQMLGEMISCGGEYERRFRAGQRYHFANMVNALREIERGTHRPYPCGAGAGYLGVSADGDLAACHRFVGDEEGAMGSLAGGIDVERRARWLAERHVHRQEPCRSCWARYLCGGGCHHEVLRRGRPACDFVRGWLHYCIEAYLRLSNLPQSLEGESHALA